MKFSLKGDIVSKKNSWKHNRFGKVYQAKQNEINGLLFQLFSQKHQYANLPLKSDCRLFIELYGDNRTDLDNQISTICDVLQKAKIISNDRQVKQIEAQKIVGKKIDSRCEIEIAEFEKR